MGNQRVWVVKDPLSKDLFYFNDQEYEILRLADGDRPMSAIIQECSERFIPHHVSAESVIRFFADAREKGLLVVDGAGRQNSACESKTQGRWWRNPLAIRLPGLNPDHFLDAMLPLVKPLFSPLAFGISLLLAVIALTIVLQDFDTLARHLSVATNRWGSGHGIGVLVIVISLTKIIHELAHAFACKRFGGECRELGVMLLVGVPCLYCDVSDAWLMDRRWKRILVSAAGMLAELTLASVATLVWSLTLDGLVRDVCVTVMVVCSVSTVLFNGNPLLRYDGYYILSDLVGIPNLANESTTMIRGWFRRILWATPKPLQSAPATRQRFFVAAYGVISGLYRMAVYLFILCMLYRIADRYELGDVVGCLLLITLATYLIKWAKTILAPPEPAVRRASMSPRRPTMIVIGAAVSMLLLGAVPLPRTVVAPMSIRPGDAQAVFVTSEGVISNGLSNGADVRAGQSLASLRNPDVESELIAVRALCERLTAELEGLQKRRTTNRELSARIAIVEQSLAEAIKRRTLQERIAQRLELTSPREGRVFAPPRERTKVADSRQPRFWEGTPLEPINRGAWLREGTVLCLIGDAKGREAVVLTRQQEVQAVQPDQRVTILLADRNRGSVTGTVLEVAATASEEVPAELQQTGLIDASAGDDLRLYQVRVSLDPTRVTLPVRMTGMARIHVSSASIWTRLGRFLRDSFG